MCYYNCFTNPNCVSNSIHTILVSGRVLFYVLPTFLWLCHLGTGHSGSYSIDIRCIWIGFRLPAFYIVAFYGGHICKTTAALSYRIEL